MLQKDVKTLVRCALSEQCSGAGAVERPNLPEQVRRWALRQAGASAGRQAEQAGTSGLERPHGGELPLSGRASAAPPGALHTTQAPARRSPFF